MAQSKVLKLRGIPTIFGAIVEPNTTFVIDTSGSMYMTINVVKEHLIEALLAKAHNTQGGAFNVIEFSSDVRCWANSMVKLSPHTVTVAYTWIRKLKTGTGPSNILDALMTAFADMNCNAVYLVTDGLPDQLPDNVLCHVTAANRGRPVHVTYLTQCKPEPQAEEFLRNLAIQTGGSLHVVALSIEGNMEKVSPIYKADMAGSVPTPVLVYPKAESIPLDPIKFTSIGTTLDYNPYIDDWATVLGPDGVYRYTPVGAQPWLTYRPECQRRVMGVTDVEKYPSASGLIEGMVVLARRETDGYYYKATIRSQSIGNRFFVEFDVDLSTRPVSATEGGHQEHFKLQETSLCDILSHTDGLRHPLMPGDKVLAPWEVSRVRYAPGTVVEGAESRFADGHSDSMGEQGLIVAFTNGKTASVPAHTAVWVPGDLYNRIKLELQMPYHTRKHIMSTPAYPSAVPTGYPINPVVTDLPLHERMNPVVVAGAPVGRRVYLPVLPQVYPPGYPSVYPAVYPPVYPAAYPPGYPAGYNPQSFYVTPPTLCDVLAENLNTIPTTSLNREDLSEKVTSLLRDSKLDDTEALGCNDSGLSCSDDDDCDPLTPRFRDQATGTDSSILYPKSKKEKDGKPLWRYWGERGAEGNGFSVPVYTADDKYKATRDTATTVTDAMREKSGAFPPVDFPCGYENSGSNFKILDRVAGLSPTRERVEYALNLAHPPEGTGEGGTKAGRHIEFVHKEQVPADVRQAEMFGMKREKVVNRQNAWEKLTEQKMNEKEARYQQRRDQVVDRISREQTREENAVQRIDAAVAARKVTNAQFADAMIKKQHRSLGRDTAKTEVLKHHRLRHEALEQQRQIIGEDVASKRLEARQQKTNQFWKQQAEQQSTHGDQVRARDIQHRNENMRWREHFRTLENNAQDRKQRITASNDQQLGIYRSQVLP